jgi:hypothetical protein
MKRTMGRRAFSRPFATILIFAMACNTTGREPEDGINEQQPAADPQTAAMQALETFRQLVNDANYRELGFESPREVDDATLGEPLEVVFVRLDQLREYQLSINPEDLLNNLNQMSFPVLVHEGARSSIVVQQQQDGRWRSTMLGNGALARQIEDVRGLVPGEEPQRLVHVGALGLHFLASRADDRLMFTALATDPSLRLRAGMTEPADTVLARLVPFARRVRDDEPM